VEDQPAWLNQSSVGPAAVADGALLVSAPCRLYHLFCWVWQGLFAGRGTHFHGHPGYDAAFPLALPRQVANALAKRNSVWLFLFWSLEKAMAQLFFSLSPVGDILNTLK
jgi:hypothetical protein